MSDAYAPATGKDVRVRFCPSPTGTPHVGMVRTCLFNWAYARNQGGTFVFRIEDTDAQRDSEESYQQILDSLTWLGLDWDEGVEKGGPHEPYRQSQRMDIYKDVAAKLLEAGYAYESFSTPEEVEARHRAKGQDPKLGYDGFDRDLTEEQKAAYRAEGREPVLRLRMPDEDVTFNDLVRGEITFKPGSVPDYVIVRANGDPLYTLVNPVDDALMEITHVLRGEDLLSSTPRQVVLYHALLELGIAKRMPVFGHLPYVMGEGNKKLSKRDPESNLLLHKEHGMIPEGLINYLALLGWAIGPDNDIFSLDEMVAAFDIEDVNPNPARFDQKKCVAINAEHIRMLDVEDFRNRMVPYLFAGGLVSADSFEALSERERFVVDAAAPLTQTRVQQLGEVVDLLWFLFIAEDDFYVDDKALSKLKADSVSVLDESLTVIESLVEAGSFNTSALENGLRSKLIEELQIKPRLAFGPLRTGISGRLISPPLFESMEILGADTTLKRLRALRETLAAQG
ncbi:MAG: glutamate--tRNA ligase [Actinomycetaceae bacterium]|nr:glutamate--tRNA ligase [Actinomycetaceae bacterium]